MASEGDRTLETPPRGKRESHKLEKEVDLMSKKLSDLRQALQDAKAKQKARVPTGARIWSSSADRDSVPKRKETPTGPSTSSSSGPRVGYTGTGISPAAAGPTSAGGPRGNPGTSRAAGALPRA
eukprot:RCo034412